MKPVDFTHPHATAAAPAAAAAAADAPSSYGVDLKSEAALVTSYDLPRLAERVRVAVDRSAFHRGALAGAGAALAFAVAAGAAVRAATPPAEAPSCPVCYDAVAAVGGAAVDGALDGDDDAVACTADGDARPATRAAHAADGAQGADFVSDTEADGGGDALFARCAEVAAANPRDARMAAWVSSALPAPEPAPPAGTREIVYVEVPAATAPVVVVAHAPERAPDAAPPAAVQDAAKPVDEGSRLRVQLQMFDAAERALARGDHAAALLVARELQQRFTRGPLAIEAGMLEVRALRDGGHLDEARALLTALADDPRAHAKKPALRELAATIPGTRVDVDAKAKAARNAAIDAVPDDAEGSWPIVERNREDDGIDGDGDGDGDGADGSVR